MPTPRKPKIDPTDRTTDPNTLAGPAAFGRVLGHKDPSTVSHWANDPATAPTRFPLPDDWKITPTRRTPQWRLSTMWHFADHDAPHPGHAGGRQPGATNRPIHPYSGDPRLIAARQLLATRPDATNAELIRELQYHHTGRGNDRATWHLILHTARLHPRDDDGADP